MIVLKHPVLCIVGAIALAGALSLPSHWRVERSTVIAAEPRAIYARLANLPRWREWMPWDTGQDRTLFFDFDEPYEGPGAAVAWEGERIGRGGLILAQSDPDRGIVYELSMDGNPAPARGSIAFERTGEGTQVTWTDSGTVGWNPVARLFLPLLEASLTKDIELGLARLKNAVESGG